VDSIQYRVSFEQRLSVRESENPKTALWKVGGPFRIVRHFVELRVLTAVQFHHQTCLRTIEVENVRAEGMLAAKLVPFEAVTPKVVPET